MLELCKTMMCWRVRCSTIFGVAVILPPGIMIMINNDIMNLMLMPESEM